MSGTYLSQSVFIPIAMPRRLIPLLTLAALSSAVLWGVIELLALQRHRLGSRRSD